MKVGGAVEGQFRKCKCMHIEKNGINGCWTGVNIILTEQGEMNNMKVKVLSCCAWCGI